MSRRWCLGLMVAVLAVPLPAAADRPYAEFLEKLKQRQYYDYVLLYLDELQADPNVPAGLRTLLPYERALIHLQLSGNLGSPNARAKHLAEAETSLEKFLREQPDHPLAAKASSTRANLAINKAREEIRQFESAGSSASKQKHQQLARELIARARSIFQQAHDGHQAAWEKFPPHIDEKDQEQHAARALVENGYLRSQLDLARCTYEEARTYKAGSGDRKKLLTRAADEFETIHQKYRSQGVGLHARMWQGKCFEEQDDIRKALGIYDELLDHQGTSATMRALQDHVRWFRLICLNHPQRREQDSTLVIDEATEWLKTELDRSRSHVGFGIRWERGRANEYLSNQRDIEKKDQTRYKQLALADAETISQFPNPLRDQAVAMVQRLTGDLNNGSSDPRDFDTAFALARKEVAKIKDLQNQIEAAADDEAETLQTDFKLHLLETARLLRLALGFSQGAKLQQVNTLRYYLAFVYYTLNRNYEAGVLAEFIARNFRDEDPQMALDAAHLAMAAYQQAYNAAPEGRREADLQFRIRVCRLIAESWPNSDRAHEARLSLGDLFGKLKRPAESARWYALVPQSSTRYGSAQLAAGQALWTAYLQATLAPEQERPDVETLMEWQRDAEKHLLAGIQKFEDRLAEDEAAPDELTAGKVSLSQIMVNAGRYEEAAQRLTGEPRSVIGSVAVEQDAQRDKRGVRSAEFAALAYQLLLRSYVGMQQVDEALEAMQLLEGVASTSSDQNVTNVYVQLGKELQEELTRLQQLGQTERLAQVRGSLDRFLAEMFDRRQGQSYGVLIWIAETYYGLAQAMQAEDGPTYFSKAADTYRAIVERAAQDAEFVSGPRLHAIKLRLAGCLSEQGRFEEALAQVGELLKDKPKALNVQFTAAELLQRWGAAGQPQRYLDAIRGFDDEATPIWGWGQIALRLQRALAAGPKNADYEAKYFDARYNISFCREQYALAQNDTSLRTRELEAAIQEIEALAAVTADFDDERWTKFDALYRDLQRNLGRNPPLALERPVSVPVGTEQQAADANPQVAEDASRGPRQPPSGEFGSMLLVALMLLVLVAGGVGAYALTTSQSKGRRALYAQLLDAPPPVVSGAESRGSKAGPTANSGSKPKRKGSRS